MATPPDLVVACAQLQPRLGDMEGNVHRTCEAIRSAAAQGAHVVVLPELASSGYAFVDQQEAIAAAQPIDGPCIAAWKDVAAELGIVVVGGFCELGDNGSVYNSAAIIDDTGVRAIYRKAHLWDRERLIFEAGEGRPPVVDTAFGRIGVVVCYDLEFPEWVRVVALARAQLLCAPVNWPRYPRPVGERPGEVVRVQADAAVNRMFIAACDRVGSERGVDWVGGSVIVDADGWPLAGGEGLDYEAIMFAQCRLAEADDKGVGGLSDIHADRRPGLYSSITDSN